MRYGLGSENKALVQITNADHDWDKKIHIMDVEQKEERSDYSVNVNGQKIVVLIINNNKLDKLYLLGEKGDHPIMYSELRAMHSIS